MQCCKLSGRQCNVDPRSSQRPHLSLHKLGFLPSLTDALIAIQGSRRGEGGSLLGAHDRTQTVAATAYT
jgi:hypothetical protein